MVSLEGKDQLESQVLPSYSAYARAETVCCHVCPQSFHMNAGILSILRKAMTGSKSEMWQRRSQAAVQILLCKRIVYILYL